MRLRRLRRPQSTRRLSAEPRHLQQQTPRGLTASAVRMSRRLRRGPDRQFWRRNDNESSALAFVGAYLPLRGVVRDRGDVRLSLGGRGRGYCDRVLFACADVPTRKHAWWRAARREPSSTTTGPFLVSDWAPSCSVRAFTLARRLPEGAMGSTGGTPQGPWVEVVMSGGAKAAMERALLHRRGTPTAHILGLTSRSTAARCMAKSVVTGSPSSFSHPMRAPPETSSAWSATPRLQQIFPARPASRSTSHPTDTQSTRRRSAAVMPAPPARSLRSPQRRAAVAAGTRQPTSSATKAEDAEHRASSVHRAVPDAYRCHRCIVGADARQWRDNYGDDDASAAKTHARF